MTPPAVLDLVSYRYASATGPRLGHLLPRAWDGSKLRPAACGIRRAKWRPVHAVSRPDAYPDCPDCSSAARLTVPDPVPLHTTPAPTGPPLSPIDPGCSTTAHPITDPQRAHAALPRDHRIYRGTWLPGITTSRDYIPQPYDQHLHEDS